MKKRNLQNVLPFIGILLFGELLAQNYYFADGREIPVYHQKDYYVLHFQKDVSRSRKLSFLSSNNLVYESETLNSEYIIVKTTKHIDNILKSADINEISRCTRLYYSDSNIKFTITDRIIFKTLNHVPVEKVLKMIKAYNPKLINKKWLEEDVFLVSIKSTSDSSMFSISNNIHKSGLVEFAHPEFLTYNWMETNDTYYSNQWNLTKIAISNAWSITTGNSSIIIAILDSGVESDHPDLEDDMVTGYDVVDDDYTTDPYSGIYHGTCCAGIAAACTNNSTGIAGIGYNCNIMPIQFTHTSSWSNSTNFAQGITWASNNGADIINISGNTQSSQNVNNAINSATSNGRSGKGCIIVKSAGNGGSITFPGQHEKVISVGATDTNDYRISYSSYGSALDVMAPSLVYATDLTGSDGASSTDYMSSFTGTSAAAPHVSGLAALILSEDNTFTEKEVRDIICFTSDDKGAEGWDQYFGWGRINAYNALRSVDRQFTTTGTMQYNQCWWGTVTLTGNVFVPTNKKLHFAEDATINLNGYYIKSTGGKIIIEDDVTFNSADIQIKDGSTIKGQYSTFSQAWSNVSTGEDVYLDSDTYSGSVYMKPYVGLYGDGPSSTTLTGKVYFDGDDGACLSDLKVTDRMSVDDCWAEIDNVYSEYSSSSYGLYVHDDSDLELSSGKMTQKDEAVIIASGSYVFAYNEWFCQNTWDISTDLYSYADASQCTFSGYWPGSTVQGTVYYTSWNYCGVGKCMVSQEGLVSDEKGSDPAENAFRGITQNFRAVKQSLMDDRKSDLGFHPEKYSNELRGVLGQFQAFVLEYPESRFTKNSVGRMGTIWKILGDYDGGLAYTESIASQPHLAHLKPNVMNLKVSLLVRKGVYTEALALADQLIAEFPEHPLVVEWIFKKGKIHKYYLNELAKSEEMFRLVVDRYPDHPTAQAALDELGEDENESLPSEPADSNESEETLELTCENYPNPSNPETTIYFTLPEQGRVVLKIYDIIGREVLTLVDEDRDAGRFSVFWNGKDSFGQAVSTGVYFYQLQFEQHILTGKISLIQ